MIKQFIQNRRSQRIAVAVENPKNQKGLAFVMHGAGGFKEQEQIRVMAQSLNEHGYSVVTFDATDSLGESDGRIDEISTTDNLHDLEDVIAWAKTQQWFISPFVLAGHSLGSMCCLIYAEQHPTEIKALAPLSAVVSGKLLLLSPDLRKVKGMWKETQWLITGSKSKPGAIKKMPWSFITDIQKYDALPQAHVLTMPILMAVGEDDPTTPLVHQKKLYAALPTGNKEFHILKKSFHTFRNKEELLELKTIFDRWLDSLG